MRNSQEIQDFMQEKFTSEELYEWMIAQVSSLHFQTYQLAYDLARQAERTFASELGVDMPGIVKAGYWDSLKKGLLAGEHLYHDLKRLDTAYLARNEREYELTEHVSLLQVDPLALIQLRTTGTCQFSVPEELYDLDAPGHYFRRIRNVAVSIPCVTGPNTAVHCTLSLIRSSIRRTAVLANGYARDTSQDDPRFADLFGNQQSIVTSSAQNDSGLFETNLRDERYLPFEYAGAISEWQLDLPANPAGGDPIHFDYETISDVILHIRYTAREGGSLLRRAAVGQAARTIDEARAAGSVRLFSARNEFPSEWARFRSQTPAAGQRFELALDVRPEHYPFWSKGRLTTVNRVDLLARGAQAQSLDLFDKADRADTTANKDTLNQAPAMGNLLVGTLANIGRPASTVVKMRLFFDDNQIRDLWLAVTWGA
jgi:hypothetical protein